MADWKTRARDARRKLRHAKHGEREAILRSLSGSNDPNTLRRAMFALSYLDEVKQSNPPQWRALDQASLFAVEFLARWHAFDPSGAARAAAKVGRGEYTIADLEADMRKAKLEFTVKSYAVPYRDQIQLTATETVQKTLGGNISRPDVKVKNSNEPALDFRYIRTYGRPAKIETVAGLVVGPYQSLSLYRKRRFDWLYRAFGLAWLYNHVFIFLPEASELNPYQEWIKRAQERSKAAELNLAASGGRVRIPSVYAIHIAPATPPELTEEQSSALRNLEVR